MSAIAIDSLLPPGRPRPLEPFIAILVLCALCAALDAAQQARAAWAHVVTFVLAFPVALGLFAVILAAPFAAVATVSAMIDGHAEHALRGLGVGLGAFAGATFGWAGAAWSRRSLQAMLRATRDPSEGAE